MYLNVHVHTRNIFFVFIQKYSRRMLFSSHLHFLLLPRACVHFTSIHMNIFIYTVISSLQQGENSKIWIKLIKFYRRNFFHSLLVAIRSDWYDLQAFVSIATDVFDLAHPEKRFEPCFVFYRWTKSNIFFW